MWRCAMIAYNYLVYSLPDAAGLRVCGAHVEPPRLLPALMRNMGGPARPTYSQVGVLSIT